MLWFSTFVQSKKREKHPWRGVTFSTVILITKAVDTVMFNLLILLGNWPFAYLNIKIKGLNLLDSPTISQHTHHDLVSIIHDAVLCMANFVQSYPFKEAFRPQGKILFANNTTNKGITSTLKLERYLTRVIITGAINFSTFIIELSPLFTN